MKFLFAIVKYLPVVVGILMTIHCLLLLMGKDDFWLREFFPFSWLLALVLTILSYKLKFCYIHRMYIWYDFLLDLCIKAQRYELFADLGCDVDCARLAVLTIGITIQVMLICRLYGKRCKSIGGSGEGD